MRFPVEGCNEQEIEICFDFQRSDSSERPTLEELVPDPCLLPNEEIFDGSCIKSTINVCCEDEDGGVISGRSIKNDITIFPNPAIDQLFITNLSLIHI